MTTESQNKDVKKNKKVKPLLIIILIILLILLTLIGLYYYLKNKDKNVLPVEGTEIYKDTIKIKIAEPQIKKDTIKPVRKKTYFKPKKVKPKIVKKINIDTTVVDTVVFDPCIEDTIAPWVYPDPSGGLHYGKIFVHFVATKQCSITWRFKNENKWHKYENDSIEIAKNVTLCFKAKDSCGNTMNTRYENYEITMPHKKKYCPKNMEYISMGNKKYCIDRYEWPNRKKSKPKSNISIYHAMDSCFKTGKRLCTTEEWSLACAGIYNWKYTYGDKYEPYACVTRDTTAQKIGQRPECRGYFQVFDMSGNLSEWTNTKSKKNSSFYNVMGGFWESGPQSTCSNSRYSYYPMNTHNPVGFRCCKEANKNVE